MMSKKKRGFLFRRKRPYLMSEKERKEYIIQSILKIAAKEREKIYGITPEKRKNLKQILPISSNDRGQTMFCPFFL